MYRIKQIPEDFIVEEIFDLNLKKSGEYAVFELEKKDYSMQRATQLIKEVVKTKKIGYAGIKDKVAITKQKISLFTQKVSALKNYKFEGLKLTYLGQSDIPISLGDHKGNKFKITIRNLDSEKIVEKNKFKNFFGEQRFSENNVEIGLYILRSNFKEACKKIISYSTTDDHFDFKFDSQDYNSISMKNSVEKKMLEHLIENKNDYITALKLMDQKILKLYISAVQSQIFNNVLEMYNSEDNIKIPLVGFATEIDNEEIENNIFSQLTEFGLTYRNFVIKQIPQLSSEGDMREAYVLVNNLKIRSKKADDLNLGKHKVIVEFELPKGSYATVFISQIIK